MTKLVSRGWIIILAIIIALMFIPLPYYVTQPGMAKKLSPIIQVENATVSNGSFMLTTVRMGEANVYTYTWAKFNDFYHLYEKQSVRAEGEDEDEYHYRQLNAMESSQEAATVVAYTHANKDITIDYNGVYVLNTLPGMPADEVLDPGDLVIAINGEEIKEAEDLIDFVGHLTEGEVVTLTIVRNDETQDIDVELAKFPEHPDRIGVGISLVTDREVNVEQGITIDTAQIGGPSAGLMFSLEIYDQLIEEDLTKGYDIAGTGTINYEGVVGPIGGIDQKIVAADKTGAEIFFAPNMIRSDGSSDYKDAVKTAEQIGSSMEIVPVGKFEDAITYLENLKPKGQE